MAKLIYIHDDDEQLFGVVLQALKEHGYSPDYASPSDMAAVERIHADIALIYQKHPTANRVTIGDITLDLDSISVFDATGHILHFTPIEFSMLSYLMKNAHRAVPRDELLSAVWDFEGGTGTRVADDTAKRLRRKLRDHTLVLETVWNYGFRVREK